MNNEAFKQNLADVARSHMDSVFGLAVCCNSVSAKLWCRRIGVHRRRSYDVDNAMVQRHLDAVGVTLRCHPERQANAFSSSGIITTVFQE